MDDSFVEKIQQKSKARQEWINELKREAPSMGKKRAALDEQQTNSEEPPKESPKRQCIQAQQTVYSPHDKENIQLQDEVSNDAFVPLHSARNKGLAALKKTLNANDDSEMKDISQPQVNTCQTYIFSTNTRDLCSGTKSRFTNLAANIRQWEDDQHRPTLSSTNVTSDTTSKLQQLNNTPNSSSKSNTISMKLYYTNKTSNCQSEKHVELNSIQKSFPITSKGNSQTSGTESNIESGSEAGKKATLRAWDQAIAATLATSNKAKYPSNPLTEFPKNEIKQIQDIKTDNDFNEYSGDESINEEDFAENYEEINSEHKNNYKMGLDYSPIIPVHGKAQTQTKPEIVKKISNSVTEESINANVDPAELPLAARKALFEKALLGGAPKLNVDVIDQKLSVAQRAAMFENVSKNNSVAKQTSNFKEPKRIAVSNFSRFGKVNNDETVKSPVQSIQSVPKVDSPVIKDSPVKKIVPAHDPSTPSPTKNIGSHTRIMQQKLFENSSNSSTKEIIAKASEERKQEISNLVNHWEKLSSSSAENNSEKCHLASEEQYSGESDADEEYSEYEEESDSGNLNDDGNRKPESSNDDPEFSENVFEEQNLETESLKSDEESYSDEHDLHSDDVQSSSSQNARSVVPSTSVSGISSLSDDTNCSGSKSQSCSSDSSARSYEVKASDTIDGTPSSSRENKNPDVPLIYTVSFYRKQKQETRLTPVRTIVRREKVSSPESPKKDYTQVIQDRIKDLQEEILRQQTVISQTSQALNLCNATAEFSGSTEQVEGERLLLIATQKRQACLNEIQRLKTCGAQGENISDGTGTLIITDIQLPLKREFMASQLEGKGNDIVHYFLCLIRHGPQVIVTQMMSTNDKVTDGALCFTNHIKLQNLSSDFSVVFEVYALQAKKEVLPHEKKYHIKREHSKIRLTPKGKKSDGKILMPAISSPGGPNAVRSPSFGVVGYSRFTLQNCNKHIFTLDKVPFTSPLDGVLRVKLRLHAEHKVMEKGFLTMFEDVSGFGAWHRRWCVLDANHLAYWKYPDDEQKKEPIGNIDLKQCVTAQVKLVATDICARPHTFQLVIVRPQEKGDKNTLISKSINTWTTIKHLLSADTKEERILWCKKLNEALTNVRKWDPQALRPVETMQEKLSF